MPSACVCVCERPLITFNVFFVFFLHYLSAVDCFGFKNMIPIIITKNDMQAMSFYVVVVRCSQT